MLQRLCGIEQVTALRVKGRSAGGIGTSVAPVANLENHGPSARGSPSTNAGHKRNFVRANAPLLSRTDAIRTAHLIANACRHSSVDKLDERYS